MVTLVEMVEVLIVGRPDSTVELMVMGPLVVDPLGRV